MVELTGYECIKKDRIIDDTELYLKLYGKECTIQRLFYNISAGAYKGFGGGINHPCWTNIDVNRPWKKDLFFPGAKEFDPEKDIAHDLLSMKSLPVKTATAALVHSRFTVDRLTDEAAQFFFDEVYRILKKGGVFRLVSTNLDLDYRAYIRNDKSFFFWLGKKISIEQAFLTHVVTQMSVNYHDSTTENITDGQLQYLFKTMPYEEALNYCTSKCSIEVHKKNRYDHLNWWNWRKYKKMLDKAGFATIYLSAPEQSLAPVMRNERFFDNEHLKVMMYVEGVKD